MAKRNATRSTSGRVEIDGLAVARQKQRIDALSPGLRHLFDEVVSCGVDADGALKVVEVLDGLLDDHFEHADHRPHVEDARRQCNEELQSIIAGQRGNLTP